MTYSKFPGLREASDAFAPFSIMDYRRDPEYGYEHVYLLFIRFKDDQYGLCIWDAYKKEFIEEPGELWDYALPSMMKDCEATMEELTQMMLEYLDNKYSFKTQKQKQNENKK